MRRLFSMDSIISDAADSSVSLEELGLALVVDVPGDFDVGIIFHLSGTSPLSTRGATVML